MDATVTAAAQQRSVREYDTKIDNKKRITLRGSRFEYYHVVEFPNGKIELQPRERKEPFEISRETLRMMDLSMENLKKGITSEALDLSAYDRLQDLDDEDDEGAGEGIAETKED